MDEKSIQSLNGHLDTLTLMKVIPNLKNFATLVSLIRKWAKGMCRRKTDLKVQQNASMETDLVIWEVTDGLC
jgi:hypothetical protein